MYFDKYLKATYVEEDNLGSSLKIRKKISEIKQSLNIEKSHVEK